jgi:hypothetical protein
LAIFTFNKVKASWELKDDKISSIVKVLNSWIFCRILHLLDIYCSNSEGFKPTPDAFGDRNPPSTGIMFQIAIQISSPCEVLILDIVTPFWVFYSSP